MRRSNPINLSKISLPFYGFIVFMIIGLSRNASAGEAKVIRLSDSGTAEITISGRGTVLSFPMKPTKVILGKANSYGIEYCDNDLAISPLSPTSRSHLYVYLYGRRFSFDLITSMMDGHAVILVRDDKDKDRDKEKEISTKAKVYE